MFNIFKGLCGLHSRVKTKSIFSCWSVAVSTFFSSVKIRIKCEMRKSNILFICLFDVP